MFSVAISPKWGYGSDRWVFRMTAVIRGLLIAVMAIGLASCGTIRNFFHLRFAQRERAIETPRPADGLWAIMDPGCQRPAGANFQAWPACASPFWINANTAVVVHSPQGRSVRVGDTSYRAGITVTAGEPVVVQVGSQEGGFLYVAVTDMTRDSQGLVVAAAGAPVSCVTGYMTRISFRPNMTGCEDRPTDEVRRAAAQALSEHEGLTHIAWIAPGAPTTP